MSWSAVEFLPFLCVPIVYAAQQVAKLWLKMRNLERLVSIQRSLLDEQQRFPTQRLNDEKLAIDLKRLIAEFHPDVNQKGLDARRVVSALTEIRSRLLPSRAK